MTDDFVWIPPQTTILGSDAHYAEEAPAREVTVDGFWLQTHQVTNAEFAEFVDATGYLTVAERPLNPDDYPGAPPENLQPGSMVFHRTPGPVDLRHLNQWWTWTPGACWNHPRGPRSSTTRPRASSRRPRRLRGCVGVRALGRHPVAHRSAVGGGRARWRWPGRSTPGATSPNAQVSGSPTTGTASSPTCPTPATAPRRAVGSFAPNGYGLYDMAGNVWEWTTDWWADTRELESCCAADSYDPAQPQFPVGRRVIKGGSFLCADSYCLRYRPAARRPQAVDTGMSHIGFRCVRLA